MLIVLLILLAITIITSKKNYGLILSPYSIFLSVFTIAYIFLISSDFIIKEISELSKLILLLSMITFIIGTYLNLSILKINKHKLKKNQVESKVQVNYNNMLQCIIILFIISSCGFVMNLIYLNSKFGLLNILLNPVILNTAIANDQVNNSIHTYMMILSIPNSMLILYYIINNNNSNKKKIFKVMFIFQILLHFSVKRNRLFYAIILNLLLYIYTKCKFLNVDRKRKINMRQWFIFVFVAVFMIYIFSNMQNTLNKQEMIRGEIFGIAIPPSIVTIIKYFSANLVSMGLMLDINYQNISIGTGTFRFLYKILESFNLISFDDSYLAMKFVNIPTPYNTAPIQYYIYRDFGMIGMMIVFFIIGYISSNICMKVIRNKREFDIFYLAIISFILIMSIREYLLIFLDFWIIFMTLFIVDKYTQNKIISKGR
ncbi:MAG: O-antigen polymerase [Peptostreptococcaceae bacterium]